MTGVPGAVWSSALRTRSVSYTHLIYVISVDPAFQRHGLGRFLAVAGLDWLAERVTVGMLYVEATNEGAVELYGSLGFTVDHVDRCYLLDRP